MRVAWCLLLIACGFEHGTATAHDDARPIDSGDAMDDGAAGAIAYAGNNVGMVSGQDVVSVTATGMASATYVLGVSTKPHTPVMSVVGLGATWTSIADQCGARGQTGVALYVGRGATQSGDIAVQLGGSPLNAIAAVGIYTGTTANGASARYNASNISLCNIINPNVDVASYSFPIAATKHVAAVIATRSRIHTPGTGLTQRVQQFQGSGGDVVGIAVVDGPVATVAGTFSGTTDAAAVAIELRP